MRKSNKKMKGGDCRGASDYGVYVWGIDQTAQPNTNIIQAAHDPRLFGQPTGMPQVRGGSGLGQATISPSLINESTGIINEAAMSKMALSQMQDLMKPNVSNVSTDSANPAAMKVNGGKDKSKKKIYTKNKRHNGKYKNRKYKRRTTKVR